MVCTLVLAGADKTQEDADKTQEKRRPRGLGSMWQRSRARVSHDAPGTSGRLLPLCRIIRDMGLAP